MKQYSFEVFGVTDCGILNKVNEDTYVYKIKCSDTFNCGVFAVADGVGGLKHGDIASSVTISSVNRWWENNFHLLNNNINESLNNLLNELKNVNQKLLLLSKSYSSQMATTLSILVIYYNQFFIVHIGDSRIYKCNPNLFKLTQLSIDHSKLIEKYVEGKKTKKNVLTECIGYNNSFSPYICHKKVHAGEIFILCTDGIFKKNPNKIIFNTIKKNKNNMKELCNSLVNQAKEKNETDNITIIAVKILNVSN